MDFVNRMQGYKVLSTMNTINKKYIDVRMLSESLNNIETYISNSSQQIEILK